MKNILILISILLCQYTTAQKKELHIVFEKSIKSTSELKDKIDQLLIGKRLIKKFETTIYFTGNRVDKDAFDRIKLNYIDDRCKVEELITSLTLKNFISYCTNENANTELPTILKKEIKTKLKKAKKNKTSDGILLYEAELKPKINFNRVPTELTTSNICEYTLKSNSFQIIDAKIWIETKDQFGNWNGTEKKDIKISKGLNNNSIKFNTSGRICIEYDGPDGYCTTTIKSELIVFNFVNEIRPIKLIHKNNCSQYKISDSEIDLEFADEPLCKAQYMLGVSPDFNYYFYVEKQSGIDFINMEMEDLCRDESLSRCPNPITLKLTKDYGFETNEFIDRYIINSSEFNGYPKFSCKDLIDKKDYERREWRVTFKPISNSNRKLNSQNLSTYTIIFNKCN